SWTAPSGSTISDGITTSSSHTLTTPSDTVFINFKNKTGSVRVKANNDCGTGSQVSLAVSLSTSPKPGELELADAEPMITLYPNPANSVLHVSYQLSAENTVTLRVTDVLGKEVLLQQLDGTKGANTTDVDVSRMVSGVYQLLIRSGELTYAAPFVVQ
ncbi:MAG: T9SS type A sorting domain-containing protein, partial [Sphingobacteriales bacterium]